MNGNRGISNHQEKDKVEESCLELRAKLLLVRKKRQLVHELYAKHTLQHLSEWLVRREDADRKRHLAINEYQSAVTRVNYRQTWMNLADEWNVTNDCFHIWHRGPFGTINGLRLASEVPLQPRSTESGDGKPLNIHHPNSTHDSPASNGSTVAPPQNNHSQVLLDNARVPWVEINSALGLVVFLLSTLEKKANSGIKYQNKLVPQGSTSKIGVRKGESFTFYNLFSDDNFQFFGKRSFNIALNGLLRCLYDAYEVVEKVDRTMTMPYPVECDGNGSYTIGGLSISYSAEGDAWTRAMKYVLTDAKWLVAFATKHVDC